MLCPVLLGANHIRLAPMYVKEIMGHEFILGRSRNGAEARDEGRRDGRGGRHRGGAGRCPGRTRM
ncbi:hypothetical protein RHCRD62_60051 [Rhodococcus sp. RD6.2]|nr:hypothetical protein RHCRD62_60051 [Rhodococcus sp. RD6.2]